MDKTKQQKYGIWEYIMMKLTLGLKNKIVGFTKRIQNFFLLNEKDLTLNTQQADLQEVSKPAETNQVKIPDSLESPPSNSNQNVEIITKTDTAIPIVDNRRQNPAVSPTEQKIMELASLYIQQNQLTYEKFDEIFGKYPPKKQYQISDILYKNHIDLVDEIESTTPKPEQKKSSSNIGKEPKDISSPSPMNHEMILSFAEPYVHNGEILEKDFIKAFDFLTTIEQQETRNILSKHAIQVVSVLTRQDGRNNEIKKNPNKSPVAGPVRINRKVKLDNKTLVYMIQKGNKQAEQDLCVKNERLVYKYATRYVSFLGQKIDIEDIVQYGMMGMLVAAKKFDFAQDTEFSTYATFWIKQSIIRNIVDKEFLVRIPVHLMEKLIKVQGIETKLGETIDYDDKISLIAQETNSSPNQVENYLTIASAFLHMPSLDIPVGEEDTVLSSFIPDDKIKSTEEVMNKTLHEDLEKLFSRYLKKREIKILKLRYGLEDGTYHTLQEVGDRYGVTRERIRQIEAKAILKLKKPAKRMNLLDYLES